MEQNKTANRQAPKLISLREETEARKWARSFNCTPDELEEAMMAVGHSADAVRKYLSERKGK